jgi:CheY-like chemotaxis protein
MRILIIEDTQKHIEAAQKLLADHELTICKTFHEAERVLAGAENGFQYREDAEFPFDVVLTDLHLPLSLKGLVENPVIGTTKTGESIKKPAVEVYGSQIPYGVVIALAAMRRGVPVAIVSDGSHHSHPINWALDLVASKKSPGKRLMLGTSPFLTMEGCYLMDYVDGQYVKLWDKALDILMKEA